MADIYINFIFLPGWRSRSFIDIKVIYIIYVLGIRSFYYPKSVRLEEVTDKKEAKSFNKYKFADVIMVKAWWFWAQKISQEWKLVVNYPRVCFKRLTGNKNCYFVLLTILFDINFLAGNNAGNQLRLKRKRFELIFN